MSSPPAQDVQERLARCVDVDMLIDELMVTRARALGGRRSRPLLQTIDDLIAERRAWVEDAETLISAVEDPTARALLRHRYIDGWTWEKVSDSMNYSIRHLQRLHGAALEMVGKLEVEGVFT